MAMKQSKARNTSQILISVAMYIVVFGSIRIIQLLPIKLIME